MKVEDITLDWLMERVIERDGCWIWNLSCSGQSSNPQANIGGKVVKIRRVIWELSHGRKVPKNHVIRCECSEKCMHPDHLICSRKSSALKGVKKTIVHRLNMAIGKREKSKYSDGLIEVVKQSENTPEEESRLTGISESYIRAIRGGLWRKNYRNPFAGLGA